MRTLIKNATCVWPDRREKMDVLVDAGKIAALAPAAHTTADEVVDAHGLYLLPGIIDDQVHFREPGLTHKEDLRTGSIACAKGGVTTFLEMPNTKPTTTTAARLEEKLEIGARQCVVNYGFYVGATTENIDELTRCSTEMGTRTPGIKIFIGSSTGNMLVDEQEALERIFAETTLPICAHCEDESTVIANSEALQGGSRVEDHSKIRDHEAARIATARSIDLAQRHRHRFHVLHMSTAQETELMRDAGPYVTAEACVHHLWFSIEDYPRLGTRIQMNPSIKTTEDIDALWTALGDGRIQVVATDHAPHTLEEKARPYPRSPSGLPAVENSLALMLDGAHRGKCRLEQIVQWMCEAPAKVWDIVGKGRLEEGYDADLVLVDLEKTATVRDEDQQTKSGWSPWNGVALTGWPVRTWVGGQTVWCDGELVPGVHGSEVVFDHSRPGFWA